jgi:hypothetical protein
MDVEMPLSCTLQCAIFGFGLWLPTHITAGMLFVVLFKDAFSSLNCIASNGKRSVNDELEGIWKEAVVASFELQSPHMPFGTEENEEKSIRIGGLCSDM